MKAKTGNLELWLPQEMVDEFTESIFQSKIIWFPLPLLMQYNLVQFYTVLKNILQMYTVK